MKALRKTICSFWLILTIFSSCSSEKPGKNSIQDEAEIKSSVEGYMEAFNKKDDKKLAALWEQDAILHNPITDETVEGRAEIENYFKKKFETNKNDKIQTTIESIVFTEPNNATVKARFQVTDAENVKIAGRMLMDYIKEDGKWYILRFSGFEKLQVTSQFDKLEKLNWLVGAWVDESEGVEISSKWGWDKHKNFLTERFTMKVLDDNEFEGFQIIGWDPAHEKIHLWVFDSDGGFGEGTLAQEDHNWYASIVYTLPDGKIGSATNIYTKVDDNTYTFSSVGRDIDGIVLPNVGPYKIVRKQ